MTRGKRKFIAGGIVILAALGYLVYAGVSQSVVYFVTPGELAAAPVAGKAYRLGGMVKPGTLKWDPRSLELTFTLSDGQASVPSDTRGHRPISSRRDVAPWSRAPGPRTATSRPA